MVDRALYRYVENHPTRVHIEKIGEGYFKFGTRRIFMKVDPMDETTLLVRVGPKEYITLSMFIIENEG